MRRRIALILRGLLFALGLVALLWFPASFYLWADAGVLTPDGLYVQLGCLDGRLNCWWIADPSDPKSWAVEWRVGRFFAEPADRPMLRSFLWPSYHATSHTLRQQQLLRDISLPLWLLAVVCLAWPVTSFLVRQPRRGRGFSVETTTADDAATESGS